MSERGEFEKRLFLPYAEMLWRRYAYTHRKEDGRFPSRNEYINEVLDEARKEIFPIPLGDILADSTGQRTKILHDLKDWLPFINKLRYWFGSVEK